MAGVRYTLDLKKEPARTSIVGLQAAIGAMIEGGEDLTDAMDEIGDMMVSSTLRRFELGIDPNGQPWEPSQRALIEGGQTLIKSGRLRDSVHAQADSTSVIVGSNLVYAAIHQTGGQAGRNLAVDLPARAYLGLSDEDSEEVIGILSAFIAGKMEAGRSEASP